MSVVEGINIFTVYLTFYIWMDYNIAKYSPIILV